MKVIYRFFSVQNLLIFASIFFLSQNVMADRQYIERGLAGSGESIKIKIRNIGFYTIDKVTVKIDDLYGNEECVNGKSVTREINLSGGLIDPGYGVWYLNPDCRYSVSAKSVSGNKSIKSTSFYPAKNCKVTFKGPVMNRWSDYYCP